MQVAEITFNFWYKLSEVLYGKNSETVNKQFKPYVERLIEALYRHCQIEPDHVSILYSACSSSTRGRQVPYILYHRCGSDEENYHLFVDSSSDVILLPFPCRRAYWFSRTTSTSSERGCRSWSKTWRSYAAPSPASCRCHTSSSPPTWPRTGISWRLRSSSCRAWPRTSIRK